MFKRLYPDQEKIGADLDLMQKTTDQVPLHKRAEAVPYQLTTSRPATMKVTGNAI